MSATKRAHARANWVKTSTASLPSMSRLDSTTSIQRLSRSPGSAVVFPVFLPVVQHPTSPQRDRPADAGRRALRPRQRNPGSASTRTQRCLHTAPRALRQRTASATASSWRSVDQSTAEHYRMRTNSSVNFHARCLIRLDTVRSSAIYNYRRYHKALGNITPR